MSYQQLHVNLAKFGFKKSENIRIITDKDGKSEEKRKISKDNYESRKRMRTFVPAWSSKFPGIEDTEAGIVCTVCKMRTGEICTNIQTLLGT